MINCGWSEPQFNDSKQNVFSMTEKKIQDGLKRSVVFAALSVTVLSSQRPDFLLASQDIPLYPVPMAWGGSWCHPQAPSVGIVPVWTSAVSQNLWLQWLHLGWSHDLCCWKGSWPQDSYWTIGEKGALFPMRLLSCYNASLGVWATPGHHVERTSLGIKPTS